MIVVNQSRRLPYTAFLAPLLATTFLALMGCGTYTYPSEDSSIASHMSFANVHSDASKDPAVITGSVTFNGAGTATHVVVAAKVGGATGQADLSDMPSGSSQNFRVEISNSGGSPTFQMHVVWVESGATGRLPY